MPRMRAWLIGLAAILVVAIVAVWQVPQYLDWNRYRATLEVLASTTLGRPVTIHGPITLNLLPQPVLTAAQVSIGGDAASDVSIRVEALRLRVALWPLLGGRVDARELVLRGPDLLVPWPAEPDALRRRAPAWLAAFSARIENGRLTVGRVNFTGIDATLASYDEGASSASGTAQFNRQDWHFTARTTSIGADGAAGLNVTLDGQGNAMGLAPAFLDGSGRMARLPARSAAEAAILLCCCPRLLCHFARTDGSLLAAAWWRSMTWRWSSVVRRRLVPWLCVLRPINVWTLHCRPGGWTSLRGCRRCRMPARLSAASICRRESISRPLRLSLAAAPCNGCTATFDLANGALMLREAEAVLPGNARLHLTGRITRGDDAQRRFEGNVVFDAPVLRTTLRWLGRRHSGTGAGDRRTVAGNRAAKGQCICARSCGQQ